VRAATCGQGRSAGHRTSEGEINHDKPNEHPAVFAQRHELGVDVSVQARGVDQLLGEQCQPLAKGIVWLIARDLRRYLGAKRCHGVLLG
jgi:hypothetical protein